MHAGARWTLAALVTATVAAGVAAAPAPQPDRGACLATAAEEDAPPPCCVANPRYHGLCSVELAEGETCQDVLDYLNNAAAVGKTYCGSTPIRLGWKQVDCQEDEE